MLRLAKYLSIPQEFDDAARIFLDCSHYAHAASVLTSARYERFSFLHRYIQTLRFPSAPEGNQDESWREEEIESAGIASCGRILTAYFVQRNGNVANMTYVVYDVTLLPLDWRFFIFTDACPRIGSGTRVR